MDTSTTIPSQKRYLEQVAEALYRQYESCLPQLSLLLPTYHAGNIIIRALGRLSKKPTWAPRIYTLPTFMQTLYKLDIPPQLTLLSHLYQVMHSCKVRQLPFEDFTGWGSQLLEDFNTLDHYLISPERLLSTPKGTIEEQDLPPLAKTFWHATLANKREKNAPSDLLWDALPTIYQKYKKLLLSHKIAYSGLQRKQLYHSLQSEKLDNSPPHIILIGLTELTPVEEKIFTSLAKRSNVALFPETLLEQVKEEKWGKSPPTYPTAYQTLSAKKSPPEIIAIEAKGIHGQVTALSSELQKLIKEKGVQEIVNNSAIILPDPTLLLPLLHALPQAIGSPYIRMGYPLTETNAYTFLTTLLHFHLIRQEVQNRPTQPLLESLNNLSSHPYAHCTPHQAEQLQKIANHRADQLPTLAPQLKSLAPCIQPTPPPHALFSYIKKCLSHIQQIEGSRSETLTWEKVALHHTIALWDEITRAWPEKESTPLLSQSFIKTINKYAARKKLMIAPPAGEKGIEILTPSQTASRNFSYLYILSMNEGIYPQPITDTSFIPHLLQEAYGWPKKKDIQKKQADLFHRLLLPVQKVFFLYSQRDKGIGERSHYLAQLQYQLRWKFQISSPSPSLHLPKIEKIIIPKKEAIMKKLATFLFNKEGHAVKRFTPSALNAYLDCPLHFYLQYVAKIKAINKVESEITPPLFGKFLHQIMEKLYTPYIGEEITSSLILHLKREQKKIIAETCLQDISKNHPTYFILQKILNRLVEEILLLDKEHAPFHLHALEFGHPLQTQPTPFTLSNGETIALGGIIDRIDQKEETIRILDYKTGKTNPHIPSIETLFDPHSLTRNKVALQLLWYAYIYSKQDKNKKNFKIMPAIITPRTTKPTPYLTFSIFPKKPLYDIHPYINSFEKSLRKTLDELFDPTIPFQQTQHPSICPNCPHPSICMHQL